MSWNTEERIQIIYGFFLGSFSLKKKSFSLMNVWRGTITSSADTIITNRAIRCMLICDQYGSWLTEDGEDLQLPVVLLGIHSQQNDGL